MLLLVAISLLPFVSLSIPISISDSSPVLPFDDQVRQIHLYTESKHRSLFLEIFPNGTVTGTPRLTAHTVLELKAIKPGQATIRGVASSLYLCVDEAGQLTAADVFMDDECSFRELLQPDGYSLFLSAPHKLPISLTVKGLPHKHELQHFQFLPLRNRLTFETEAAELVQFVTNLDSDDPFGLRKSLQNNRSPLFHMDA